MFSRWCSESGFIPTVCTPRLAYPPHPVTRTAKARIAQTLFRRSSEDSQTLLRLSLAIPQTLFPELDSDVTALYIATGRLCLLDAEGVAAGF